MVQVCREKCAGQECSGERLKAAHMGVHPSKVTLIQLSLDKEQRKNLGGSQGTKERGSCEEGRAEKMQQNSLI